MVEGILMSPTVHRERGFRFFFFSNEGSEPAHIHVEKGDGYAKIWLDGFRFAEVEGFDPGELRWLVETVRSNESRFRSAWNEFFKFRS